MTDEEYISTGRNGIGGTAVTVSASTAGSIDRAQKLLAGLEGGVQRAVKEAVKKAAARLKNSSAQAVRERYAISASGIRNNEAVRISYSFSQGAQATVYFSGRRIPLYRFDGASPTQPTPAPYSVPVLFPDGWRMSHPGVPASGHALKSTLPTQFDDAFTAKMKSGHVGIFERTGGMTSYDKDKIEELYGPSVPQMLGSEEVESKLTKETMAGFEADLDDAVLRILSGGMRL